MSMLPLEQLYETDFYAWTQAQAKELRRFARTRPNVPLDLAHLAEEIQDLGRSEYEAAFSLMQRVIEHLLLIEHSPATEQRLHWADEIDEFRDQLERKLSPAIRRRLKREFEEAFARARRRVQRKLTRYGETQAAAMLPPECPYTLEQVVGDWLPHAGLPDRA
jgi:Domain of unknown function DUF29